MCLKVFCKSKNLTQFIDISHRTFDHVGIASYQLFILLTTENFPVSFTPAAIIDPLIIACKYM